MRVLFMISGGGWNASARAFLLAARGLIARGHEVLVACDAECPVQARATGDGVPVVALNQNANVASDAWQLRRTLQERGADVIFVHTDAELLRAGSAVLLGRGTRAVIRRVPPFSLATGGRGVRFATKLAPTGLLFSTEADLQAANLKGYRVPAVVAPLAVDVTVHDAVGEVSRSSLGIPADARLIVCVHDGSANRRVFTAMRTLALLAPRHPELHLAIVGSGKLDELRMLGAALGINPRITYLGPREDELSVLRAANVGWIAAASDAAAFAALDFMALRTPVLAERAPLTEHYVADGIGGILLDPADPTITAAAVAAFLARSDQLAQMGKAGYTRLQREFPYEQMIMGFEQALAGAVDRSVRKVS